MSGHCAKTRRIASGHRATTDAAAAVLELGGNAVDAAIAAAATACVAEPLLCSLGGGALAIVRVPGRAPVALDAFTQTPRQRHAGELDFYPIIGHFGTDTQEFHVGLGSMATPGVPAGLAALSERFGRLPLDEALAPAISAARDGVELNAMQHHTLEILQPIVRANPACSRLFGLDRPDGPLPVIGTRLSNPELADFLEDFGQQGPDCFYRGEPARKLAEACVHHGGHLHLGDLAAYRVRWRRPLRWRYRDATLWSAPPPAFGGMMLALALGRLAQLHPTPKRSGREAACSAMIQALDWTDRVRQDLETPDASSSARSLRAAFRDLRARHALVQAGTTHISVEDENGLGVAITLSNGEASGYVIPGTGILMNNMLGEEDINRAGFHAWPCNRRLASMMAPTLIRRGQAHWLLGSGGSNRIRSALTQVIARLIDGGSALSDAIEAARLHVEGGLLSCERPTGDRTLPDPDWWRQRHPEACLWPRRSLYFGGVHAISHDDAAADPRREGRARILAASS
ncbi:gamma-glutamyltransferase [Wenzhouxiangella marina]|uniref:Gamma-glutamyltranspeptidase n=1 Tax=Wenzhouxiangella marina TaxID=1579979 RepID=A0A0K0XSG7_9GAMM|nr:gamma-glutamyltransferase [Wenzhouxiangella marina]AKS40628.1 Gamma-glutamyltranspeptidase [Wenzhouxiangella marina]MBB6088396.1 gamma-glutamyltranspeptidase/glutathione hydrolase [Wenzhouxiangella marina]